MFAGGRYEAYLAGLPGGLDAYPESRAKGALVRSLLEGRDRADLARRLPAPLRPLVEDPPVDSEWISEARFGALSLALADLHHRSEAEVVARARERSLALFAEPAYRLLMQVGSPEALLRHAGRRWSHWHRGSTLELDGYSDDGVRLSLAFPPGLFDRLLLKCHGAALGAALELSRATAPEITVEVAVAGRARFHARW